MRSACALGRSRPTRPLSFPRWASLSTTGIAVALLCACGAQDEVELVHPTQGDAARRVMEVDYHVTLTAPDNFVLRPDEFGGVTVDRGRSQLYAGSRDGQLFALHAENGGVVWTMDFGGAVASLPVLADAKDGEDGDDPALLLIGTDNGVLHAIGINERETVWSYETPGRIRNAPVVHEGVVFFANSRDQVYALDLRTGDWRWQYEQELQTDFTVHGHAGLSFVPSQEEGVDLGTVYSCFDNGKVVALAAGSASRCGSQALRLPRAVISSTVTPRRWSTPTLVSSMSRGNRRACTRSNSTRVMCAGSSIFGR